MKLDCPHCKQQIKTNDSNAGSEIDCPECSESLTVPGKTIINCPGCNTIINTPDSLEGMEITCPKCGVSSTVPYSHEAPLGYEKMLDSAVCDICTKKMQHGEGYILSTRQVVTTRAYWECAFQAAKALVAEIPREMADAWFNKQIRQQCFQITGWMTCVECLKKFPLVDKEKATQYAKEFWAPGGDPQYSPPGGGAVDTSEAILVAQSAWEAVTGLGTPKTDIFPPSDEQKLEKENEEIRTSGLGNIKPGTKVARAGTYKCCWCGPDGMAALPIKMMRDTFSIPLQMPPLAQKSAIYKFYEEGETFPECPNGCGNTTGWSFVSSKKSSKKDNPKEGCFIATAVMDDYEHPVVLELRVFRDEYLEKHKWGQRFISSYYKFSPFFANIIAKSVLLKKISYLFIIKPLTVISKWLMRG